MIKCIGKIRRMCDSCTENEEEKNCYMFANNKIICKECLLKTSNRNYNKSVAKYKKEMIE